MQAPDERASGKLTVEIAGTIHWHLNESVHPSQQQAALGPIRARRAML